MTEDWQAWIEAGRLLHEDPAAEVPCPACGTTIQVLDVPLPDGGVERHLTCPACGATNAILIRYSPDT